MHKLKTSAKDSDDLSFGFDRDPLRTQRVLANYKNKKENYHVRFMLKDAFGHAEHQKKLTHGLGYNLTLSRIEDLAVLNEAEVITDARIKTDHIHWCVPQYTPSFPQQGTLSR